MFNWNTDEKTFKKRYPKQYKLWRIVQLINHGLDGEKLNKQEVKKVWLKIKARLNLDRRKVLEFLFWNKKWRKEPGLTPSRSSFWIWRSATHT